MEIQNSLSLSEREREKVFLPFATPSTDRKSVILWNNLYGVSF